MWPCSLIIMDLTRHHKDPSFMDIFIFFWTGYSTDCEYVCLPQENTSSNATHCIFEGNNAAFGGAIQVVVRTTYTCYTTSWEWKEIWYWHFCPQWLCRDISPALRKGNHILLVTYIFFTTILSELQHISFAGLVTPAFFFYKMSPQHAMSMKKESTSLPK